LVFFIAFFFAGAFFLAAFFFVAMDNPPFRSADCGGLVKGSE
jgi:hypothetical protein